MSEAAASTLSKAYDPAQVEARWSQRWEELQLFRAQVDSGKPPFVIACPPPNVTGSLHLGHAVNGTIQDLLARFHRMKGFEVLWQPGTDHAGIATQYVVEKRLKKERKLTRHDLGREAFLKEVWAWKEEYGHTIVGQYRRLGASLDVSRWRFTMDPGYARAVRVAFVKLHEKGYLYRGHRMVNWCPACLTGLSDLEVADREQKDAFYHVRYPLADGSGSIVVATVRPETMLGDVAVAVHPEDERYAAMVGQQVRLPLGDRLIPVVADAYVEKDFGTGALKITPAHDANDHELGARHGLPILDTFTPDGKLNELAGPYAGLSREAARKQVVADLEAQGFLEKVEPYLHNVSVCSRCDTVLEPRLSDQWFLRMAELAKPAIEVVEQGQVRFHPERWSGPYLEWMRKVRDWNVSRQLWWGHQIPVWACGACGQDTVALEDPTQCAHCGSDALKQEQDVLDTWFSSALWTYATLGWPEDTPELRAFHPTSVLSTARDILYLWVARMIFTALEFRQELPFTDVIIHATILDPEGRRMSKSKGTGVDPLEMFDRFGTDATRFWMAGAGTSAQDVRFRPEKIEDARNFANKLWNAARFALMKAAAPGMPKPERPASVEGAVDRWILSRLDGLVSEVSRRYASFEFLEATQALYEFTWNEFCDWYLELAKGRLEAGDPTVRWVLAEVLGTVLKLLHPVMPFITEELYGALAEVGWVPASPSLQTVAWPEPQGRHDAQAESELGALIGVVGALRALRAELKLDPAKLAPELFVVTPAELGTALEPLLALVGRMARAEAITVCLPGDPRVPTNQVATTLAGEATVVLPLGGFDGLLEKERVRLAKELEGLEKEDARLAGQLGNEAFVAKAPPEVVDKLRSRRQEIEAQRSVLQTQAARLA